MRKSWRRPLCTGLALALGLAGCGTAATLQSARSNLAGAKQAGAESKATYDYHAALFYLEHAQHEYDEMDYEAAQEFAEKSLQHSAAARQKAGGGAR